MVSFFDVEYNKNLTKVKQKGQKTMKLVIQRVSHASVTVEGKKIGAINRGLLVFVGVGNEDTKEEADRLVKKMVNLRIFDDENGKTNLALKDVDGELLIISQFTLYADCRKGNRPSFVNAGSPQMAEELYEYIIEECKKSVDIVEHGEFGADMKVELLNDGPFTILLE
jgi:D-tyrosyl-tRNA(Tyr) deacylase